MAVSTASASRGLNGGHVSQESCSESASSTPSVDELEICRGSSVPVLHCDVRSTYHIYHEKERHADISPTIDPSRDRLWGPTIKESKEKRKQRKLEAERRKESISTVETSNPDIRHGGTFFLHTPYLAFHDPPRVLYWGSSKQAVPTVLIQTSAFWRTYKLQLGPSIARSGVLDPRGVVCWRHNGGDKKARRSDDRLLRGYKVRDWRLWGESGKEYVQGVRANREAGAGLDPDAVETREKRNEDASEKLSAVVDLKQAHALEKVSIVPDLKEGSSSEELSIVPELNEGNTPAQAEEVVYLKWTSPFSRNTRRYHFQFAGIDFYWKGTGTVKESRTCGFLCHFNHLKLVARLPADGKEQDGKAAPQPEVCLGKYTSSIAAQKSGKLDLYDGAIWRLMEEHMPSAIAELRSEELLADARTEAAEAVARVALVKKTMLYQVIVATATCMMLGEKQKRKTVKQVIMAALTEGGGNA